MHLSIDVCTTERTNHPMAWLAIDESSGRLRPILLGRHKSWVCRRLAMMEKLCVAAQEDLRLGLLSPTMARQLVRLPAGNQQGALETGRRHSLTAAELRGVVDLLLASGTREKAAFVLERPRQALRQAQAGEVRG